MLESFIFNDSHYTDLNMYQYGMEDCTSKYSYGPAVRDHFLIHYILKGKGLLKIDAKTYYLKEGQGFLICPNVVSYYEADVEEPWSYAWVGFNGHNIELYLKGAKISKSDIVFEFKDKEFISDCFEKMISTKILKCGRDVRLHGYLCILLSQLIEEGGESFFLKQSNNIQELYVNKSIEYITMNYSRKISVNELAQYIGLDRSYLCKLFNIYLSISPQMFLINFRINKACELMSRDILSIGDIARSVGFDDPLVFSKAFKKAKGVSPKCYRLLHE